MKAVLASDLSFAVPPADYLREELSARGENVEDLAARTGLSVLRLKAVVEGNETIDLTIAEALARHFDTSANLWLNLDRQYREALDAEKPMLSDHAVKERVTSPNGKVALRIPKSLHSRVVHVAEAEGVSMNQLLVVLIAEGVVRHEKSGSGA